MPEIGGAFAASDLCPITSVHNRRRFQMERRAVIEPEGVESPSGAVHGKARHKAPSDDHSEGPSTGRQLGDVIQSCRYPQWFGEFDRLARCGQSTPGDDPTVSLQDGGMVLACRDRRNPPDAGDVALPTSVASHAATVPSSRRATA